MSNWRIWTRILPAVVLGGAIVLSGCAASVPCDTSTSDLDRVRMDTESAVNQAESAQEKQGQLESEIAELEAQLAALEGEPEKLEEKIEALKKGSGRSE